VIVVDTSAMVEYLVASDAMTVAITKVVTSAPVAAPHVLDLECASALRRLVRGGVLDRHDASVALGTLRDLRLARHAHTSLLPRIWQLRDNMGPYDAAFVALAEALGAPLVTVDSKFQGVPGLRCEVRNLRG
jgi:predicted nucleic acid-binding protein